MLYMKKLYWKQIFMLFAPELSIPLPIQADRAITPATTITVGQFDSNPCKRCQVTLITHEKFSNSGQGYALGVEKLT